MINRRIIRRWLLAVLGLILLIVLSGCGKDNNTEEKEVDNMDTLQFAVMSAEDAAELYPAGYDIETARSKGLIRKSIGEEKYQQMEAAYLAVLNRYLEETAGIGAYEAKLRESGYTFPPLEDNLYYRCRSYGRENLCLRNAAYIERLSPEQLELLEKAVQGDEVALSPELQEMIAQTWKEILPVHLDLKDTSVYPINYEMDAINDFEAYNDALVFLLGFSKEYDEAGDLVDAGAERGKITAAKALCEQMEKELSEKLDCHVRVFLIVE
ncbi:MAG: hypothetical protein IJH77_06525 [Mogibacterium sp.]|nr:hypothetical protein [Mogibacterium sp.]